MSQDTVNEFEQKLQALSTQKLDIVNLVVNVGYSLHGGKKIPTLTVGNEAPINFPSPADTKVQSLLLRFGGSNYGSGKREYLKFEAVDGDWTIKRMEHSRFANAGAPNFGAGYDVDLAGPNRLLKYSPLREVTVEKCGPTIEGTEVSGAESQAVIELGKKGTELPPQ
ncbi:MAG: hypothetical protein K2X09_01980 [Rickettsiales bacterium]|nr:hypothetical protein [Rickettsiales bacterium]